ncbi:MAG TPA: Fic family protein [Pyrinomonadaceae bacterium]|jgi:Fic family protein
MINIKELEMSSEILQAIRLVIKDAAFACLNKSKRTAKEKAEIPLFKSMCEALIPEGSIDTKVILKSRLAIYDYLIDFAVTGKKISIPWICKLHALILSTYKFQRASKANCITECCHQQPGQFKHSNNRIERETQQALFGAPVERTSAEMQKYCHELRSKLFLKAHPILQASYAHYALVTIHPFANGNGRTARSLAFTFMYRSNSIPILSLNQDRVEYISALRAADTGDFQPFIELVQERSIESATQIKRSILSAMQQIES